MLAGEFVKMVDTIARRYRDGAIESVKRNSHMNALGGECRLTQDEIDAVLTDFVNYLASCQGMDYGMYASDFAKGVV